MTTLTDTAVTGAARGQREAFEFAPATEPASLRGDALAGSAVAA